MLCQLSYCPPVPPHRLLPALNTPLHGRTKTMVTGHQTTECTDDYRRESNGWNRRYTTSAVATTLAGVKAMVVRLRRRLADLEPDKS